MLGWASSALLDLHRQLVDVHEAWATPAPLRCHLVDAWSTLSSEGMPAAMCALANTNLSPLRVSERKHSPPSFPQLCTCASPDAGSSWTDDTDKQKDVEGLSLSHLVNSFESKYKTSQRLDSSLPVLCWKFGGCRWEVCPWNTKNSTSRTWYCTHPPLFEARCWRAQAPKPIVVWFLQRTVQLPAGQGHHVGTFSPSRKIMPNRDRSLPVKPRENWDLELTTL